MKISDAKKLLIGDINVLKIYSGNMLVWSNISQDVPDLSNLRHTYDLGSGSARFSWDLPQEEISQIRFNLYVNGAVISSQILNKWDDYIFYSIPQEVNTKTVSWDVTPYIFDNNTNTHIEGTTQVGTVFIIYGDSTSAPVILYSSGEMDINLSVSYKANNPQAITYHIKYTYKFIGDNTEHVDMQVNDGVGELVTDTFDLTIAGRENVEWYNICVYAEIGQDLYTDEACTGWMETRQ